MRGRFKVMCVCVCVCERERNRKQCALEQTSAFVLYHRRRRRRVGSHPRHFQHHFWRRRRPGHVHDVVGQQPCRPSGQQRVPIPQSGGQTVLPPPLRPPSHTRKTGPAARVQPFHAVRNTQQFHHVPVDDGTSYAVGTLPQDVEPNVVRQRCHGGRWQKRVVGSEQGFVDRGPRATASLEPAQRIAFVATVQCGQRAFQHVFAHRAPHPGTGKVPHGPGRRGPGVPYRGSRRGGGRGGRGGRSGSGSASGGGGYHGFVPSDGRSTAVGGQPHRDVLVRKRSVPVAQRVHETGTVAMDQTGTLARSQGRKRIVGRRTTPQRIVQRRHGVFGDEGGGGGGRFGPCACRHVHEGRRRRRRSVGRGTRPAHR